MSNKIQGQISIRGEVTSYIEGRISGIIYGTICDTEYIPYAIARYDDATIFRVQCTDEQFENICKLIKHCYSKLLTIDIIKI